jgi:hypothetical protein
MKFALVLVVLAIVAMNAFDVTEGGSTYLLVTHERTSGWQYMSQKNCSFLFR